MQPLVHASAGAKRAALADKEVVARVIGGEKALYEVLMRRYNQTLYRAVRSYLHSREDVEDAMQEAYLKAYAKLGQYKGEAAFSTWLVRIGINEALQRLRREKRANGADMDVDQMQQLPDRLQMTPEQIVMAEEHRKRLESAIDGLPEAYRSVYMLREVEEMSVAEVADSLDLSEANVKVRLHRAKAMLKQALGHTGQASGAFTYGNAHCDRLVAWVMARI